MAQCPNCNQKLFIWDVKAECPHCGANIPNHNWEQRLDEDAKIREEKFFKLNTKLHRFKFSLFGTPLRIARLILCVLPALGFVLPLVNATRDVVMNGGETGTAKVSFSIISLFTGGPDILGIKDFIKMPFEPGTETAGVFGLAAIAILFLSLLLGVVAFFMNFILFNRPKSPVQAVLHGLSTVLYAAFPFVFSMFLTEYNGPTMQYEISAGIGVYVGIILFLIVLAVDIVIAVKPVDEKAWKYVPTDELQREYAISIGAITEDEMPAEKMKKGKNTEEKFE